MNRRYLFSVLSSNINWRMSVAPVARATRALLSVWPLLVFRLGHF